MSYNYIAKCVCLLLVTLFVSSKIWSQRRHSYALSIDFVQASNAREWRNNSNVEVKTYGVGSNILGYNYSFNASYYYRNQYSVVLSYSYLFQSATYNPIEQMPENFLTRREATFIDLAMGYNFFQKKPKLNKTLALWSYLGISKGLKYSTEDRSTYVPGWMDLAGESKDIVGYYPSARVFFKYNPIPFAFISLGGSYRYIFKNFQPFAVTLGVGLQL